MRKLMATIVKRMGAGQVFEAQHGGEALDLLQSSKVDLVLTDWSMPVMDGIELIRQLRDSPQFRSLPVLLFTSRNDKEDVVAALKAGADSFITKPFPPAQLKVKMAAAVKKRRPTAGKPSGPAVEDIFLGTDAAYKNDVHPLVIFGERAVTAAQLSQSAHKETLKYLMAATTALATINASSEDLRVGYTIEGSTTDITKTFRALRSRVRMLLLSSDMGGNAVTLARMAGINKGEDLGVFIVCESMGIFDSRIRDGLEGHGVVILERRNLDTAAMESLFYEYVVAKAGDRPSQLPSPEEIRSRLDHDIKSMVDLPVLPQVYQQIVALDRDPKSELEAWISTIEADPLSRAQVIRRARSPLYGFQGEISETRRAVVLLGKNAVKEIIVTGTVKKSLEGVKAEGFDVEDYWIHSVAVAIAAKILRFPQEPEQWTPEDKREFEEFAFGEEVVKILTSAAIYKRINVGPHIDPFVGGMMHDIGKVALAQGYPGLFTLVVEELAEEKWCSPMRSGEMTLAGGADHTTVGGILAESWKLGEEIRQVAEKHHDENPASAFAELIALADFIAGGLYPFPKEAAFPTVSALSEGAVYDGKDEPLAPFLSESILSKCGLGFEGLIALGQAIAPTVRRLTESMRESV